MRSGCGRWTFSGRTAMRGAAALVLFAAGCVDRRFIIESNVPNAQVYIDNNPVGAAPASVGFEYYGVYTITVVHPGYETFTVREQVTTPWYGYPGLDFVTEVLWPFHIRDTRRYFYPLHEITQPRVDELINNAEALRERGHNLPTPEHPAPPKIPVQQPAPVVPGAGPSSPLVPGVGPLAPGVPPVPPAPPVGSLPGALPPR